MGSVIYQLLDTIASLNIDNTQWGVCKGVDDTSDYFGVQEILTLEGEYVYIVREDEDTEPFLKSWNPDYVLHSDGFRYELYKI